MRNGQLGFHEILGPPPETADIARTNYLAATARFRADKANARKRRLRLDLSPEERGALQAKRRAEDAARYERDCRKIILRQKRYYQKNRTKILKQQSLWRRKNAVRSMLRSAARRAAEMGWEFNIECSDIHIPEFCPVLGMPLMMGTRMAHGGSPSLDRFDNMQGYIKGNVRVISRRANTLKSDATIDELEAVIAYMRRPK